MTKLLCVLFLSTLSLSCFSKTVKENEILRSQNVVALFNKACMEAYLDEDELSSFLLNNNFEDLNDESNDNKAEASKAKKEKSNLLDLSSDGKHYSIVNEKNKFFLDLTENTCSVLVKNINQDIFNIQFKEFRKSLTTEEFVETSKSFESRKGSINYKITAYFYFSAEDGEKLPFEFYLSQSNEKKLPYQLKLSVHIDKRKEVLSKKSKMVQVKEISKKDFSI